MLTFLPGARDEWCTQSLIKVVLTSQTMNLAVLEVRLSAISVKLNEQCLPCMLTVGLTVRATIDTIVYSIYGATV